LEPGKFLRSASKIIEKSSKTQKVLDQGGSLEIKDSKKMESPFPREPCQGVNRVI